MDHTYILATLLVISLVLIHINRRGFSPNITLANRWLRWAIFALGGAFVLTTFNLVERPFWLLVLIFAPGWFLIETFYTWFMVHVYSHSEIPLFPNYEQSSRNEEWPLQKRLLMMRDEIRSAGFQHLCSLRAHLVENLHVRASIYEHTAARTRLRVTFLPQPNGTMAAITTLGTHTASGLFYMTDNFFLPYAGFYPENWFVERKPWMRSLASLIKHHFGRLARDNETPVPNTRDPLEEINENQRALEQLNIRMGFLVPPGKPGDSGRITKAGIYRAWKELMMINYLGRSISYL